MLWDAGTYLVTVIYTYPRSQIFQIRKFIGHNSLDRAVNFQTKKTNSGSSIVLRVEQVGISILRESRCGLLQGCKMQLCRALGLGLGRYRIIMYLRTYAGNQGNLTRKPILNFVSRLSLYQKNCTTVIAYALIYLLFIYILLIHSFLCRNFIYVNDKNKQSAALKTGRDVKRGMDVIGYYRLLPTQMKKVIHENFTFHSTQHCIDLIQIYAYFEEKLKYLLRISEFPIEKHVFVGIVHFSIANAQVFEQEG